MSDRQRIADFMADEAKKWTARTVIAGAVASCVFLLTPLNERLSGIWHSPEKLTEISAKIDTLSAELQRATGEDRVIYEVQGQSYDKEPVHLGDQITLNVVVRRTRTGAGCALLNRTAIFTDESGIASAGATLRPARQVGTSETAVRVVLDVPTQVRPGRVTVYLSLEFLCGEKTVFDQTRPIPFMLLPRP